MGDKLNAIQQLEKLQEAEELSRAQLQLDAAASAAKHEPFDLALHDPVEHDGMKVSKLTFRPQRTKDVRDHDGDPVGLVSDLTQQPPALLERLSIYDWERGQAVIAGFRLRLAGGGQAQSRPEK